MVMIVVMLHHHGTLRQMMIPKRLIVNPALVRSDILKVIRQDRLAILGHNIILRTLRNVCHARQ